MGSWGDRTAKMKLEIRDDMKNLISLYECFVNTARDLSEQRSQGKRDKTLVHENNLLSAKIDRIWSRLTDLDREVILHEIVRNDWAPKLAISALKIFNGKVVSVNAP